MQCTFRYHYSRTGTRVKTLRENKMNINLPILLSILLKIIFTSTTETVQLFLNRTVYLISEFIESQYYLYLPTNKPSPPYSEIYISIFRNLLLPTQKLSPPSS